MTGIHYSYRQYQPGDEDAINDLYLKIKGCSRTREQWKWQWQRMPNGPGDMWLIEATHPDGRIELIGHHGVMPVRFSCGPKDLLFGKTENTMVLPDYRRKLLYPRFERKFAEHYHSRYDALFSVTGPVEALRQRQANGYSIIHHWRCFEDAAPLWGSLVRVANHKRIGGFGRRTAALISSVRPSTVMATTTHVLSRDEARGDNFFEHYWSKARSHWGVAPRRDAEDLRWRFWDDPYDAYGAVIIEHPELGTSLFVVRHGLPGMVDIADVSFERPGEALVNYAINQSIIAIRKAFGAKIIRLHLTDDAFPFDIMQIISTKFRTSWVSRMRELHNKVDNCYTPRKLTNRGFEHSFGLNGWNLTWIVDEGTRLETARR